MAGTRIHILEYSGSHGMSDDGTDADFTKIAEQDPDIVAMTEMTTYNRSYKHMRSKGYNPANCGGKDDESKLFVKKEHTIKDAGQLFAAVSTVKGHRRDRWIHWVKAEINGRIVYLHHTHWIAHTTNAGHVDPKMRRLYKTHHQTTEAMIKIVKQHGGKGRHSFFSGDLNVDEVADNRENNPNMPNHMFNHAGLKTIYDELGVRPRTGGTMGHSNAIYDIIGKYNPAGQIKGVRYKIYPKWRSDHKAVSAWYDIGGPGREDDDDDPGGDGPSSGNVNYEDYKDNTRYPMPLAPDDSDDHDHG